MDDHREDLDRWLQARIDPLPPPPGTFEMIRRRARRRRYRQVAVSAAAAAAVAVAVIVVPRVATTMLHVNQNPSGNAAAAKGPASSSPGSRNTPGQGGRPAPTAPSAGSGTNAARSTPPVPADFAATSVTFVGAETGWVIGQAGEPGQACATQYCTSVARTDNAGQSWYGVPAPMTGAPDGASGVSQIRFLNTQDGWAFGPQLWATSDGGQHWTQVGTGGQRVIDLETVGGRAYAIFATCGGTGTDFAAQCTSFSLYSTPATQNSWAPVSPALTSLGNGGRAGSASLVLTASKGYLLAPDGTLYAGPVSGSGSWQEAGSVPAGSASCVPGTAQPDGQPSGALLAAANPFTLALACTVPASSGGGARVFTSVSGGAAWQRAAGSVSGGTVTSIAAQPGGEIVLATTSGIELSSDTGTTWHLVAGFAGPSAAEGAKGPAGGFSFVGMTSPGQGVAVPAEGAGHAVWFTFDGGQVWQRSPIGS